MECAQCCGIEALFDREQAEKNLRDYRDNGADGTTKMLIDALKSEGVSGLSLLDIGGGVGAIQHELLAAGVNQVTSVDASSAYLSAAKEEAERRGHADRIQQHFGNFVDLIEEIPEAAIVTLDRVICCYHDMKKLVGLSASRAFQLYGVVYPRDNWWMKFGIRLINAWFWLTRNSFRIFIHPGREIDALIRGAGLEPYFYRRTLAWQVAVYRRDQIS